MERNRYPRRGQSCPFPSRPSPRMQESESNCLCVSQPIALGIAYVKSQTWGEIYTPCEGWRIGTIFPDLDKPFCIGGTKR